MWAVSGVGLCGAIGRPLARRPTVTHAADGQGKYGQEGG